MPSVYCARAPLRLGLGGGGTDINAYSEQFGGASLNATISMYAYASIEPLDDEIVVLNSVDLDEELVLSAAPHLDIDGKLSLLKGVYNRLALDFGLGSLSFRLTTYVDAPMGSGLGSSSTLVVAIIGAFTEWKKLPLGSYDIAHLAWEIERLDLSLAGGKQDQYAATFGGVNFMEFYAGDRVIVNPLRIKPDQLVNLESEMLLYFTSVSRSSAHIIEAQSTNVEKRVKSNLEALHEVKNQSYLLKEALLTGQMSRIGELLHYGWLQKKKTATEVTNELLDDIYNTALEAGATGGKISGAGGGGFFIFYCPGISRYRVIRALSERFDGEFRRFQFCESGLITWESSAGSAENGNH